MVVRSRLATLLKIAVISLAAAFVQPCFPSTPAETDGHIVRFGVVRYTTPSTNQPIVDPTIAAIRKKLKNWTIVEVHMTREELEQAVIDGKVDVFLSSAGFYRRLVRFGARDLATAMSPAYPDPNHSEGSAIIVRNENTNLKTIDDLRGSSVAVSNIHGFTGFQIPMSEIAEKGWDPDHFFREVKEYGDGNKSEDILDALRSGEADVAFLKQCVLEAYVKKYGWVREQFRVINPTNRVGECARSTKLYPTWTLGSTFSTPPEVSRLITSAVIDMPATKSGLLWGVATDYSQVDTVLKNLKIGPYEYLRHWTFKQIFEKYWPIFAAIILLILGMAGHSISVSFLVKKRTAELEKALALQAQLQHDANEAMKRLTALQKIGVVNQISSILAHEMGQPLGAISLYAEGLKEMITSGKINQKRFLSILGDIQTQADRADAIIKKVRAYRKSSPAAMQLINVSQTVSESLTNFSKTRTAENVAIKTSIEKGLFIRGDELEIELLVVNLVKNAVESVAKQEDGEVYVKLCGTDSGVLLSIEDNGPVKTIRELTDITEKLASTKENGLGLGLQIVKGIAEHHRAQLDFKVRDQNGVAVSVFFPRDYGK